MLYKKLKKLKKFKGGGSFNPSTVGMVGDTASLIGESLKDNDPTTADAGASFISGAGKGASMGAALGPYGAVAGAVIGGTAGAITANRDAKRAARAEEARLEQVDAIRSSANNSTLEAFNNSVLETSAATEDKAQFSYKNGGALYNSLKGKKAKGGNISKLSSDTVEIEGKSHDEGGVKFPELGVELEDKETVKGDYVFSDKLGFAKDHKKIAKQKGDIEKKRENDPYNTSLINTLKRLENQENLLMLKQEETRENLGVSNGEVLEGGGLLRKKKSTSTGMKLPDLYSTTKTEPPKEDKDKDKDKEKKQVQSPRDFGYKTYEDGTPLTGLDDSNSMFANTNKMTNEFDVNSPTLLQSLQNEGVVYKKATPLINPFVPTPSPPLSASVPEMPKIGEPKKGKGLNLNRLADATSVSNLYDNVVNKRLISEREGEEIPAMARLDYNPLSLKKVNLDASKTEADQQRASFDKGISQSGMSTAAKGALKASSLASTIKNKNLITQQEQLANTDIENRARTANTATLNDILAKNKQIDYQNTMTAFGAKDDIRRDKSDLAANLTKDLGVLNKDIKDANLARDQNALLMNTSDPRSRSYLARSSKDILLKQGYSNSQIDAWAKEYTDKDYLQYLKESKSTK